MLRKTTLSILAILATTLASAGPPLVCHPVEIDDAASLPGGGSDWRVYKLEYDTSRLVEDTLGLLGPSTPVLVRMETIRRATVHGKKDPAALGELLERLQRRVQDAEARGRPDDLALFDLGYFAETCKQFRHELRERVIDSGIDGYALVERAIALGTGDPEMEFAAALIASHPRRAGQARHLRAAVDGAREDSLLARNLVRHFGERGSTFDDLRASVAGD